MFKLGVCLLVVLTVVAAHQKIGSHIANGRDAAPGQFKYFASLRIWFGREHHFCGASILNTRWLVSAAHCLYDTAFVFDIAPGITEFFEEGPRYQMEKTILHPLYRQVQWYWINDIGLIQTNRAIEFNDRIQPIALQRNIAIPYTSVTVAGFGATSPQEPGEIPNMADRLQYMTMRIISNPDCQARTFVYAMTGRIQSNPIFIRNICATTQEQSGSCIGDAGSGLVANNRLVGIASYIMGVCPSQRPEIYTEVSSYVRWIESHISEE